jgi:hypothetical protein
MRGDDEAAGRESAAARPRHLQPVAGEQGRLLGAPVPLEAQREMNAVDARQAKKPPGQPSRVLAHLDGR